MYPCNWGGGKGGGGEKGEVEEDNPKSVFLTQTHPSKYMQTRVTKPKQAITMGAVM